MSSWKTTLAAALAFSMALITFFGMPLLDGDPDTVPGWKEIGAALGTLLTALGLFAARDNDKTSEDVKAGGR